MEMKKLFFLKIEFLKILHLYSLVIKYLLIHISLKSGLFKKINLVYLKLLLLNYHQNLINSVDIFVQIFIILKQIYHSSFCSKLLDYLVIKKLLNILYMILINKLVLILLMNCLHVLKNLIPLDVKEMLLNI